MQSQKKSKKICNVVYCPDSLRVPVLAAVGAAHVAAGLGHNAAARARASATRLGAARALL